ncbi:carbonic anhydrase [Bdellovibrio sp. HCB209]|uniref:carbonic anhydrase n=1 Tax=Bdellovibrio sp. HCB209 TaxID=3394354 RepID=UPI0039B5B30E
MYFRVALITAAMSLSACSMFSARRAAQRDSSPPAKVASSEEDSATAADKARAQELREAIAAEKAKQADKELPTTTTPHHASPAAEIHPDHDHKDHHQIPAEHKPRVVGPVSAEKSLGWLKNGNTRFTKSSLRNDGAAAKDRARLSKGQKPHAIVLSCSDSRVPPELIFDQKLGEIFVVRTAGEALDNNVIGSIEYAVDHLGSNHIVVLGHSSCGAVRAALASLQGADLGSPALNGLVADLKPRLQQYASSKPSEEILEEVSANVDGVARDLLARSQILRDAMASGEVKITRAVYHLDSGKVEWRQ